MSVGKRTRKRGSDSDGMEDAVTVEEDGSSEEVVARRARGGRSGGRGGLLGAVGALARR